jgi:hypothetical protein
MKKILWIRRLSCEHERPTNVNYMMKKYDKPKIGDECFCRECNSNVKIIDVYEADKKELKIKNNTKEEK